MLCHNMRLVLYDTHSIFPTFCTLIYFVFHHIKVTMFCHIGQSFSYFVFDHKAIRQWLNLSIILKKHVKQSAID